MTANYTKVRTHAKTIGIINEFFQKYRGRTSYMWDPASVKLSFVVLELTCS